MAVTSQFVFGSYSHAPGSIYFKSIHRAFIRGQTMRTHLVRSNWLLEGKLIGTSMQDLQGQLSALQSAYAFGGYFNAGMKDNNGNQTQWWVYGGSTIGGIRITAPVNHHELKGAEGITYLKYTVGIEWDLPWANQADALSYQETLSFRNNRGAGLTVKRFPQNAPPLVQRISQGSGFYCVQSGSMTQLGANPQPAQPLFDGYFDGVEDSYSVTQLPTRTIQGVPIEYGISWQYKYYSPTQPFTDVSPSYK